MMTVNQMGQPQKQTLADQQLVILGRVLQSLREEENVDVLIETTISYLKQQFDYHLIWIGFYDRVAHRIFGKGGISPTGETAFLKQRFLLNSGDLLEQVVIQQRPVGVADLRTETRAGEWRRAAQNFKIQGTMVFPIRYKDRCFGVVLLGSHRWGVSPKAEEKARLNMILGELGAVLYQIEMDWQHREIKRPDEPLLRLVKKLENLNTLDERLEAVVEEAHLFISPTRTNIYWFERQRRYFWRRVSNRIAQASLREANQPAAGITVLEVSEFYQALVANQIVSIGEGHSSLKAIVTGKLLQRIRARSILAAPIIAENELLGFLAVEGTEARIWTEQDKNFVKAAAGLVALVAPLETIETTIQQIQADAKLRSEVARAIYSDREAQNILQSSARQLLERLSATRFLLLQYNSNSCKYEVRYQCQPHNRRPLTSALDSLPDVDWQLLERSSQAVAVENLGQDLRFFSWHSQLLACNVRSLLICNCAVGHAPEALLIIAHEATRSWSALERDLVGAVSQQLGVIVRQWQMQAHMEQQEKILQSFHHCLRLLEQTDDYQQLQQTALKHMASVLGCPLAVLLSWSPGEQLAKIIPGVVANSRFTIKADALLPIHTEALIQWCLGTEKLLALSANDLPFETRQWLSGAGIGQILAIALRTNPEHEPTAVVLMADHAERQWSEQSLTVLETLVCQLAWSRRHLKITETLQSKTEELQQLNWYKHRRLEEMQRFLGLLVGQLNELGVPKDSLSQMRQQQLLRQLGNMAASMTQLLKQEQWRMHIHSEVVPIASVLKRSLQRLDTLMKQRKLWLGVHGLAQQIKSEGSGKRSPLVSTQSSLAITGDIVKIELVLYELLVSACQRSQSGGRIDIWCRPLEHQWLEVSITDNGTIEPRILADLHQGKTKDILAASTLNKPPVLNLLICQNLMEQLEGELNFYKLQDGRIVSRLLLPLASGN